MYDHVMVSVIMSVFNADVKHLDRAVRSILDQTYKEIEFIIIDDGTTEDCLSYLQNLEDNRVRLLRNEENIGLAASLNKGIEIAKGKYIARMDSDDYSMPERLDRQVQYMEANEDVDVLACIALDIIGEKLTGGIGGAYRIFDNEDMKAELSLAPKVFPHPTVMYRASFLKEHGLRYDESFLRAQDYDMWARCSVLGRLDSLQEVLLLYDAGNGQALGPSDKQIYFSNLTKLKCLERLIPEADNREKDIYVHMRDMGIYGTVDENLALLKKLILSNRQRKVYNNKKYRNILYFWWGRKMLYKQNRQYLGTFFMHPIFLFWAFLAYLNKLPGHLLQQKYEKRLVNKAMNEGIYYGK